VLLCALEKWGRISPPFSMIQLGFDHLWLVAHNHFAAKDRFWNVLKSTFALSGPAVKFEGDSMAPFSIQPAVAIIAGVVILAGARSLNYVVALYLILVGMLGLLGV